MIVEYFPFQCSNQIKLQLLIPILISGTVRQDQTFDCVKLWALHIIIQHFTNIRIAHQSTWLIECVHQKLKSRAILEEKKSAVKSGLATRDSYEDPSYYSVACFGQLLTFVTFPTDCWETRPPWTEFFSTLLFCPLRHSTPDIEKQLKSFNAQTHKKLSHWISCKSLVVSRKFIQDKYKKK